MTNETLIKIINDEINAQVPLSDETLSLMLDHIGSLSPDLRDLTIYSGWCKLFSGKLLSLHQKELILDYVLKHELLFFNINEKQSDAVFTRSFSSLLLVILLEDHYQYPWLSKIQETTLIQDTLRYMSLEKDTRGLVESKGWAHAFAHGADLLKTASKSESFGDKEVSQTLAILKRILIDIDDFLYDEEGRLALASTTMLRLRKLESARLIDWLTAHHPSSFNITWRNYLMTLYFNLKFKDALDEDLRFTLETLLSDAFSYY